MFFPKVAEPKEFMVIEGAEHFDLYDVDQYVDQVVERVNAFFRAA